MTGRASQITDLQQVMAMIVSVTVMKKKTQDKRHLHLETSLFSFHWIMIYSLITTRHHTAFLKTWHLHLDLWSTYILFCLKVRPLKRKQNVRLSYHNSVNKPAETFKNANNQSVVQSFHQQFISMPYKCWGFFNKLRSPERTDMILDFFESWLS